MAKIFLFLIICLSAGILINISTAATNEHTQPLQNATIIQQPVASSGIIEQDIIKLGIPPEEVNYLFSGPVSALGERAAEMLGQGRINESQYRKLNNYFLNLPQGKRRAIQGFYTATGAPKMKPPAEALAETYLSPDDIALRSRIEELQNQGLTRNEINKRLAEQGADLQRVEALQRRDELERIEKRRDISEIEKKRADTGMDVRRESPTRERHRRGGAIGRPEQRERRRR